MNASFGITPRRFLGGVALAALLLGGSPTGALAGKPGGGGSTGGSSGTCSVTPNPVAVGADYTVKGSNLGANRYVNVNVSDAVGTTTFFAQTDGAGSVTVVWHAYRSGTSTVKITDNSTKRTSGTVLASCSFQVS